MVAGVCPRSFPSTNTRAPGGVDRTSTRPSNSAGAGTSSIVGAVFACCGANRGATTGVGDATRVGVVVAGCAATAAGDGADVATGAGTPRSRIATVYPTPKPTAMPITAARPIGQTDECDGVGTAGSGG